MLVLVLCSLFPKDIIELEKAWWKGSKETDQSLELFPRMKQLSGLGKGDDRREIKEFYGIWNEIG